ncbi:MAG: metallophosphoesterase family protein [Geodermatophilaceae bacterium]
MSTRDEVFTVRQFRWPRMVLAGLVFLSSAAVVGTSSATGGTPNPTSSAATLDRTAPVVSVAGDIACGTTVSGYNGGNGTATECRQKYTSNLILDSDAVWTLGDHTYPSTTTEQLNAAYQPTWGRKKSVTFPSPGDHDYRVSAGADYFAYFGRPPYYSFNIGGWHVISLNSEINQTTNSPQLAWLRADLAATRTRCIAAFWGEARWTSGSKGNNASHDPFWQALYAHQVDLALVGDTHNYERFAKMSPSGSLAANGIRQFVVGTGGRSLDGFPNIQPNSQARHELFGVLQLTLYPQAYHWEFIDESRTVRDSGTTTCNR